MSFFIIKFPFCVYFKTSDKLNKLAWKASGKIKPVKTQKDLNIHIIHLNYYLL